MDYRHKREEAIKYIEAQMEDGYVDLGLHDQDELEIIKEAVKILKVIDKFSEIPTVNPISADDLKKVLKRSNNETI